jgi:glycosyltransferase involved in cell wall biosynthesis
MAKPKLRIAGRVWLDVSTLSSCPPRPTGIPRVLLSLTRELVQRRYANLKLCVVVEQRGVREIAPEELCARFFPSPAVAPPPDGSPRRLAGAPGEEAAAAGPAAPGAPRRRFTDRLWARPGRQARPCLPAAPPPPLAPDPGPYDVLVSLGGGWTSDPEARLYRRLKQETGVRVVQVLYDLIPIYFPHFFPLAVDLAFTPWFRAMAPITDLGLAISRRTRDDFAAFCARDGTPCPPVEVFRLGEDFQRAGPAAGAVAGLPPGAPADRPFVLSVGTVEVRKNHGLLYRAWRQLLLRHGPEQAPVLVIAGGEGWLTEDLRYQIRTDPVVRDHIRLLHDVEDAQLARLYDACLVTLYPSYYEGWGLPVCESLSRGKVCIASNAASIPEIADSLTELHDPDDLPAYVRLLERFLFDADARRRREEEIRRRYRPTRWGDTAAELVGRLEGRLGARALVESPPPAREVRAAA